MLEFFISLWFFTIVCMAVLIYKCIQYKRSNETLAKISWAVTEFRDALFEVHSAQFSDSIAGKYRITDEEEENVRTLLLDFRKDTMIRYFLGHRVVIKSKYCVFNEHYFMALFYMFLCRKQDEYARTNLAITASKLNYITYMYCKEMPSLSHIVPAWEEKVLRNQLDSLL